MLTEDWLIGYTADRDPNVMCLAREVLLARKVIEKARIAMDPDAQGSPEDIHEDFDLALAAYDEGTR